ncbi:flavin reductase family protein [Georgenia ruanii]|nr:flavin reductase family protein [Georgenia ruanii]
MTADVADLAARPGTLTERRTGGFPGMVTPAEFKAVFRNYPAGVAVITADAGDGPVGLTATSVISVSAEPPLLVFSLASSSSATAALRRADTVVVHLLGAAQLDVAKVFATSAIDRFADTSLWDRLPTGEPYLVGAATWLRGRIVNQMSAGSSVVLAAQAVETHAAIPADVDEEPPLVYHNRTWHGLTHRSKIA